MINLLLTGGAFRALASCPKTLLVIAGAATGTLQWSAALGKRIPANNTAFTLADFPAGLAGGIGDFEVDTALSAWNRDASARRLDHQDWARCRPLVAHYACGAGKDQHEPRRMGKWGHRSTKHCSRICQDLGRTAILCYLPPATSGRSFAG